MTDPQNSPETGVQGGRHAAAERDLADVPAAEVIAATAVHLMSAAAVKCGLAEEGPAALDLDEARKLITALAGLVTAARTDLGVHAAPLLDGVQALQAASRTPPARAPASASPADAADSGASPPPPAPFPADHGGGAAPHAHGAARPP